MEITNAPASLGDFIAFRENPFNVAITLPSSYPILAPVTAELWFRDVKQVDQSVPVTVTGQKIEFTFTVVQLRAMVKAKFYILFNGEYVFFAPITATMGGAIPSAREVTVSLEPVGEVLVSVYSDKATVGAAQAAANDAKGYRDDAYDFMIEAQNASTGAIDSAGTFNASTGVATQAQSATNPATTFTPTASSTKPKGYYLDINVAGTTSITGSSISVAKGGKMRSNGVGFPWTYIEPTDTGYQIATDLNSKFKAVNLVNTANSTLGRIMQSNGLPVPAAGFNTTEPIPVTPGQVISMNTSDNTGFQYGCWFNSLFGAVAGTGWNGPNTKTVTVPAGAAYFMGTYKAAPVNEIQVEVGPAPTAYVPFDEKKLIGTRIAASQILPEPDYNLLTDEQLESLEDSAALSDGFDETNLANPANFFVGRIMQANGLPVMAAGYTTTGLIPVTPGQVISMNTELDAGFIYGCYFNSLGGAVAGTGWFEVDTKTATVPSGAASFMGTFKNASKVLVELSPAPRAIVPYGHVVSSTAGIYPSSMPWDPELQYVTKAEKARLANLSFLDSKFGDFEAKGILQRKTMLPSPISGELTYLRDYLLNAQTDEDFVLECYNGSKSTGIPGQGQYCSPSVNSHLLFEFCRQENFYTKRTRYIWQTWFPAQKQARFDTPSFFTETGSGTQTNDARYWGHQWHNPSTGEDFGGPSDNNQIYMDRYYRILTNNGSNASVSFSLPASYWKAALMMSYSHLATAQLRATVTGGNGILEYETSTPGVYAELNGHDFNTSTPDEFKANIFQNSTKIRKDQFSMPIKIRRQAAASISSDVQVTFTALDGKQIEYWGLYYTRSRRLFIPVCAAMGSHNSEQLSPFFDFGLLKRKPNFILYDVDIVNQWRAGTDTPTAYGTRISDFATSFLAQSFVKGVLCTYGMWHRGMNVFDTGGVSVAIKSSEGYNSPMEYIRRSIALVKALKSVSGNAGRIAVSDATVAFLAFLRNLSAAQGITLYEATWKNNAADPPNADSPLMDGIHDSNMGSEIEFRFDMSNWNFQ